MGFIWAKNEVITSSVTLYPTNITLNRAALSEFEEIRYVLLGYDVDLRQLAIKPVTKEEIDLELYPRNSLHKLSVGKSYGRISNKTFMSDLEKTFNLNYNDTKGIKLEAYFDSNQKLLLVNL